MSSLEIVSTVQNRSSLLSPHISQSHFHLNSYADVLEALIIGPKEAKREEKIFVEGRENLENQNSVHERNENDLSLRIINSLQNTTWRKKQQQYKKWPRHKHHTLTGMHQRYQFASLNQDLSKLEIFFSVGCEWREKFPDDTLGRGLKKYTPPRGFPDPEQIS